MQPEMWKPDLEGSRGDAAQLVVGEDEVAQVEQALEVGVVQAGQAVGVQVEGVQVLQVGEGERTDLADGVAAQRQVDLPPSREERICPSECVNGARRRWPQNAKLARRPLARR